VASPTFTQKAFQYEIKLIFSLTKQFLIANEPVYQNCQDDLKTVAM
jgi:hypothetical protein